MLPIWRILDRVVSGLTQPVRPVDQDDRHDQVFLILEMPPDQPLEIRQPVAQRPAAAFGSGPVAP
jgi:hypothetical protein